jgi:hypothetical protein
MAWHGSGATRALLALAGWLGLATTAWAAPSVYPTGVTRYDPAKAWNGYVLFGAPDRRTYLIDMDGNEVHTWSYLGFPSELLDPAITGGARGRLLVQLEAIDDSPQPFNGIFNDKTVGEVDWDGKVLWQWGSQAPGGAARQNHDWARLPNGDTLLVTTLDHVVPALGPKPIADQAILEVTPKGEVAWRWLVSDHVGEFGFSAEGLAVLKASLAGGNRGHGFLTINDMHPVGPNRWFTAGDRRFAPENLVIDSREASFIAIIEKATGKIAWRLGPDIAPNLPGQDGRIAPLRPIPPTTLPRPFDGTSGQHDAHLIPEGVPGAGNLLVFDNRGPSGFPPTRLSMFSGSRILEIDPIKKEVVWQYSALDSDQPWWGFYSSFISSARRLPNGNTLIDEGQSGRIFQVTPTGEIVWEYVNPHFGPTLVRAGKPVTSNWVFRAQPVPYGWAPEGTPRAERPVTPPSNTAFRVPQP